jgi:hypothetical protein
MTGTLNPVPRQPAADDRFSTIGTDVPAADGRPVGTDDRAVVGVLADLDSAAVAADEIDRVQDGAVHQTFTDNEMLKESGG